MPRTVALCLAAALYREGTGKLTISYGKGGVDDAEDAGEIWSRALWDIRNALGPRLADTIIIRAQFGFTPGISMPAAAAQTIRTAGLYSGRAQSAVRAAFAARGLA